MIFDLNNRFLAGFGGHQFFMLNLKDSKLETFEISDFLYESIKSMTVCTGAALDSSMYQGYYKGRRSKNLKES